MRPTTVRSRLRFVGLSRLVTLAALWVAEPHLHTDDGCAFETHCLTCLRTVGSVAVVASPLVLPLALELLRDLPAPLVAAASQVALDAPASRGPPRA